MKTSLYQRLAISVAAAFMIMAVLLFWWSNSLAEHSKHQGEQKLHIQLAEFLAHDNPLLQDGVYDKPALENLFHTLMLLGPAFEFYFVDPAGKILTYSADKNKIKRDSIDLRPLVALIANPNLVPVYGDDPRNINRKKIFSAAPIYNGNNLQGYLYIIIGGEIYDNVFSQIKDDEKLEQYSAVLIGGTLFILIILLAVFRYFTHPIKQLVSDMKAIKAHNFDQNKVMLKQWPDSKNNEIHLLGTTFTSMVTQINQQFSKLTENDRMRRELLAHLSHDLRTPLASMQGYLEVMVNKGEQLSADEKKQYLATAQRNAKQLKRLIDQIFELAHLENGQVTVNLENFAIGEILHDIIAKFSLKAQNKNIKLSLQPQECRFIVYSDIAKLERIITNLLENALRHTAEYGEIIINVSEQQGKIKVSITDTGIGISKADIAYIFDARYRASNTKEDSTPHAGLGLAITRKLSLLLHAEVFVESKLGKGSCFSFSLQTITA